MSTNLDVLLCIGEYLCERLTAYELTIRPALSYGRSPGALSIDSRSGRFNVRVRGEHVMVRRAPVWAGPGPPLSGFQPDRKASSEALDYWRKAPDGRFHLADPDLFELVLAHLLGQLAAEPGGGVVGHRK